MVVMEDFNNIFNYAEEVNVYTDGVKCVYSSGSDGYKTILDGWAKLIDGSHDMPAFGVSINDLTLKALKEGKWVEFDFGNTYKFNGLPFEKLLIEVKPEFYGFNLIRYTSAAGYYGRCIYLDLVNKNMSQFYELLLKY